MTAKPQWGTEKPNAARPPPAVLAEAGDHDVLIRVVELLGRKWHPAILRCLIIHGPLRFNALQDEVGDISSKVLSDALDDLKEKRLVKREVIDERPVRINYAVTDHGRTLEPVLAAMQNWGEHHLKK